MCIGIPINELIMCACVTAIFWPTATTVSLTSITLASLAVAATTKEVSKFALTNFVRESSYKVKVGLSPVAWYNPRIRYY